MHELALARGVLAAAVAHAGGRPVRRVTVLVGGLRQVVPDSLSFHFAILSRGTLCEGAELEQRLQAARLRCCCGAEWELTEPSFRCVRCGSAETTVVGGEELRVESIEVEEGACTAPR
jgi:hydrogenase nickel incorporation protein HypA/HybF